MIASPTLAQSPTQPTVTPHLTSLPTREVGSFIGVWNLHGNGGFYGVRFAVEKKKWLAWEAALDGGRPGSTGSRYAMVHGDIRLETPSTAPTPKLFVVAGLAGAGGLSFGTSPMLGVGLQTAWKSGYAFRVEVQRFPQGHGGRDSGRLLGSVMFPLD